MMRLFPLAILSPLTVLLVAAFVLVPVTPAFGDGDAVSPQALVAKAEQAELTGQFPAALEAREAALTGFGQLIARLKAAQTAAEERLADGSEPVAGLPGFRAWAARELASIEAERDRCAYWVDELKKEKHGAVPHLRQERGVAWSHEAGIADAVARLRKLEANEKWEAAHAARRKCLILAKAKRRFFEAKIDALERTLKHVQRNRRLKDTDAAEQMKQQIAFFEMARKWAEARIERFDQWVNSEAEPAANEAEAAMWANWSAITSAVNLPASVVGDDDRTARLAAARGRAAWYAAKAAASDDEDGDD